MLRSWQAASEAIVADVQLHQAVALLNLLGTALQPVAAHIEHQQGAATCTTRHLQPGMATTAISASSIAVVICGCRAAAWGPPTGSCYELYCKLAIG